MDANDLYGLPLDRFVPERTALAKELRKSGRREEAAAVTAMRKPSVAAWAVNQLVRTQGRAIDALYQAGDELRRAQSQLIAGRADGRALRDAMARERAAVSELTDRARGLLSSEGQELTSAMLERVSETLHAAALDDDARAEVRGGCLHKELRHIGLGSGSGGVAGPAPRSGRSKVSAAKGAPAAGERAQGERAQRLRAARKAEADARRAAERAAREERTAQKRRDELARSLNEAEDKLVAAHARAKAAEREHRQTQRALEQL